MVNNKEWYIGIDFGTSNTCVVAYEKTAGKLYAGDFTEDIGNRDSLNIPTIIVKDGISAKGLTQIKNGLFKYLFPEVPLDERKKREAELNRFFKDVLHCDDKGICTYIGEEARDHPILRPYTGLKYAAREITPNNGTFGINVVGYPFEECGLDSELNFGNNDCPLPVKVKKLVIQFFKRVLHVKDGKYGIEASTVQQIVIGQPVVKDQQNQDEDKKQKKVSGAEYSYENILKELLAECFTGHTTGENFEKFKEKIEVIAEPQLAGVTYLFSENNVKDKKVLVIDIGGGTSDFSVLRHKDNETYNVDNIGSCNYAGDAIDEEIFNLLSKKGYAYSKHKCRELKEKLFADVMPKGSSIEIYSREAKNCRCGLGIKIGGKEPYISYEFFNPEDISVKESVDKIFDKIGDALKTALDGISGINTIFFVGGTSIITPLREKLVKIVTDKDKNYCVEDFNLDTDVVTMFGKDSRELIADKDDSLPLTCFDAVAAGACVEAIGQNNLCHRPEMTCRISDETIVFDKSERNLIIKTEKGAAFALLIINSLKTVCTFDFRGQETIDLLINIEGEPNERKLKIDKKFCYDEEKNSYVDHLYIVAINTTIGIEFKAYTSNGNKLTSYTNVMKQNEITITEEK